MPVITQADLKRIFQEVADLLKDNIIKKGAPITLTQERVEDALKHCYETGCVNETCRVHSHKVNHSFCSKCTRRFYGRTRRETEETS